MEKVAMLMVYMGNRVAKMTRYLVLNQRRFASFSLKLLFCR